VEAYPFLWAAAVREQKPAVIAVARPHHLALTGEEVTLDASRSWSADGKELKYHWKFTDGKEADGAKQTRTYEKAGQYSEILKVTDAAGDASYDFAIVQVFEREWKEKGLPPGLHVAYCPSMGLAAGQAVTFKARTFGTTNGEESWDFGDGTVAATTKSDGNVRPSAKDGYAVITHSFAKAGDYIVTVQRTNDKGLTGTARVWVHVE
jgi:PKD repeat protein